MDQRTEDEKKLFDFYNTMTPQLRAVILQLAECNAVASLKLARGNYVDHKMPGLREKVF